MSLLAVQTLVQSTLNGLTNTSLANLNVERIDAYIAPPIVATTGMDAPQVYVWGSHAEMARHTGPRGSGFQRVTWKLSIWVMFLNTAQQDDVTFPLILDAIRLALWQVTMPQALTDADTGEKTQMVSIAERMTLDYATPEATADQRTLLYNGEFQVEVQEDYQD